MATRVSSRASVSMGCAGIIPRNVSPRRVYRLRPALDSLIRLSDKLTFSWKVWFILAMSSKAKAMSKENSGFWE